jgi:hypothetical protein
LPTVKGSTDRSWNSAFPNPLGKAPLRWINSFRRGIYRRKKALGKFCVFDKTATFVRLFVVGQLYRAAFPISPFRKDDLDFKGYLTRKVFRGEWRIFPWPPVFGVSCAGSGGGVFPRRQLPANACRYSRLSSGIE